MSPTNRSAESQTIGLGDRLFVGLQYLLPHHLLSRLMYQVTRSRWGWLKDLMIRMVIRLYRVDMSEAAAPDPSRYASFNDFFTRALRPDARPLPPDPAAVLCPADGALSQAGQIRDGRIFQAKGRDYSLEELLGGDKDWAQRFAGGAFATIYLSPRDYHRVHMPVAGELKRMVYVPGRLFSVNPATTRLVPRLFARNERVVSLFEGESGPLAVILVGAIFVASMDTVWQDNVAPGSRQIRSWDYPHGKQPVRLARGEEMGRFNMGSTVILLFPRDQMVWSDTLAPGAQVRMGEEIGTFRPAASRAPQA
jgi:phosphatidylserine decarboxylase